MKKKNLIVFDMDGVLVDVTGSYREVTRRTTAIYLRDVITVPVQDEEFISLSHVAEVKRSGGLNNDWDLTSALINAFLAGGLDGGLEGGGETGVGPRNDRDLLEETRRTVGRMDLSGLERVLSEKTVVELFFSKTDKRSPLLLDRQDVGSGNLVKRIFQELYLGKSLFRELYGDSPLFYDGAGYIDRERLIPRLEHLQRLSLAHTLAIATGRPGVEARYALNRFGLDRLFSGLVSEDDVVEAEQEGEQRLRKPHPFSLDACISRCGYTKDASISYVGDMVDDMRASLRAGIFPVGFVDRQSVGDEEADNQMRRLREGGARAVVRDFDELLRIFLS